MGTETLVSLDEILEFEGNQQTEEMEESTRTIQLLGKIDDSFFEAILDMLVEPDMETKYGLEENHLTEITNV